MRPKDAKKYFGYGKTQLADKIKNGEIPEPLALSEDGRARGWLGLQIIDHHQKLLAAAAKRRVR